MTDTRTDGLVLTRVFDAPVDLLWRCFTEQEHLAKWSAPRGYTLPVGEGDLRAGGTWRCCMRDPDGGEHWLGGTYREIVPHRRLVMTHAWEENGKRGPETLVTVRFEDLGGRTKVTLEQTGFISDASRDGHCGGWSECFDLLAEHLATMRR
ncbi:MAG: SRPBCC domain-containing protein [Alphaproteobacteria bacterium]